MLSAALLILITSLPRTGETKNENWPDGIDDDADLSLRANMPNDPEYYSESYEGDTLVNVDGKWNAWSFVPEIWTRIGNAIRPSEILKVRVIAKDVLDRVRRKLGY